MQVLESLVGTRGGGLVSISPTAYCFCFPIHASPVWFSTCSYRSAGSGKGFLRSGVSVHRRVVAYYVEHLVLCISRARLSAGRFGWFETESVGLEKLVWTSALLVGACCLGCCRLHHHQHLWLWTTRICSSSYCERGLESWKQCVDGTGIR